MHVRLYLRYEGPPPSLRVAPFVALLIGWPTRFRQLPPATGAPMVFPAHMAHRVRPLATPSYNVYDDVGAYATNGGTIASLLSSQRARWRREPSSTLGSVNTATRPLNTTTGAHNDTPSAANTPSHTQRAPDTQSHAA